MTRYATGRKATLLLLLFLLGGLGAVQAQSFPHKAAAAPLTGQWLLQPKYQIQAPPARTPAFLLAQSGRATLPVLNVTDHTLLGCENQPVSNDKWKHAGISFVSTVGLHYLFEKGFDLPKPAAFLLAAGAVTLGGLVKEYADWRDPHKKCFDAGDILANTGGIAVGTVIIFTF